MAAAESAMQQGQADVYAALASVVAAGVGGQACEQLGSQCVGVLKQIATVLETPTAGLSTIAGLVAAYVNLQESWGSDKIAPIDLQSIPLSNTAPPSSPSQGIATVNGTITVANQGISTPQAGASLCGFGGDSTRCVTGIGDGSGNYALYVPLQVAGTDYGNLTMNAIDPLSGVSLGSETVDLTDLTSSAPGQIPPIAAEAPLSFNAGGLPDATAGVPYPAFSFCTPAPTGTTALCGVPPTTNPSGGQPPYHFQLGSGGFPPIGMSLNLNGLLTGTPTAAGTASFTVCAVDLSATSVCQPVSLTVNPAASSYSTLTVTYAGTGAGTASPSSSPAGIPCGTNCWSYAADTNTAVTLTETPNIGSTFAGWSGACSGMGTTCAVTMGTNQAVTATFNLAAGDSVTPSSVTLGSAGGCAGGSLSGSVNVTAAPGVTWDAYLGGAASFSPVVTFQPVSGTLIIGAYGAVSGSGSGVVTFAVNPPPQSPSYGYTCNYTTNVQESDTLVVENFSDYGSPEVFVPVSWTWIQVD